MNFNDKCMIFGYTMIIVSVLLSVILLALVGVFGNGHISECVDNGVHQEYIDNYMDIIEMQDEIVRPYQYAENVDGEPRLHKMNQNEYEQFKQKNPELWEKFGRKPMETVELELEVLEQERVTHGQALTDFENSRNHLELADEHRAKFSYENGDVRRYPDGRPRTYQKVYTLTSTPYEHTMSEQEANVVKGFVAASPGLVGAGFLAKCYSQKNLHAENRVRDGIAGLIMIGLMIAAIVLAYGSSFEDFVDHWVIKTALFGTIFMSFLAICVFPCMDVGCEIYEGHLSTEDAAEIAAEIKQAEMARQERRQEKAARKAAKEAEKAAEEAEKAAKKAAREAAKKAEDDKHARDRTIEIGTKFFKDGRRVARVNAKQLGLQQPNTLNKSLTGRGEAVVIGANGPVKVQVLDAAGSPLRRLLAATR